MQFNACIEHKGATDKDGYGKTQDPLTRQTVRAHRMAWQNMYGPIKKGIVIMHLCDNPPCINIEHLRAGTQKENIADMHSKGRGFDRKGSKHPLSKLTESKVFNIMHLIRSGYTQLFVANLYGIDQPSISKIVNNKTWTHVKEKTSAT